MRLWSLHPAVLDHAALVACWREGLLAQAVLGGATRGYTRHPQLERFRACADPVDAIGHFLAGVQTEATARGYRFDASRITRPDAVNPEIPVTDGQLAFELTHLRRKVAERAPAWLERLPDAAGQAAPAAPSFVVVPGPIAGWERP
ncbi:pyrimidine dimer DNA glycosylase/endonuclease V [Microbacterium sp. zg-Y818]|uniref:pyrimidine dimer DNA glycosylase/endonuclease V n=1 Tax=unclassified Microbacterium TaxID=2609290 RepID=UPI00214AAB88|nr:MULTISPECIES: pyrimidine dimer DNA glycosylase/endonuclease V [unclassified Microbacterium]MCR2799658.1 pyrimidine dimer DNA glycosylase/endonuclease V [Microbacterium sp. zg.Y818]WIM21647.1 pyrimidine dimer DNA glycosylase/endonuclease V [Microbacterium sp. zg-Y818]